MDNLEIDRYLKNGNNGFCTNFMSFYGLAGVFCLIRVIPRSGRTGHHGKAVKDSNIRQK